MSDMLNVKGLSISFGGLKAVNNFAINIEKGQLYGLIGPNGAGKTTIFNLLTGVYKPDTGTILLDGQNLTGKSTTDINKAGIARTFQNIRLFKDLSVLDNVKAGLHNHHTYSTLEGILRLPRYYKVEKEMDEKAMELLKVFGLDGECDFKASNLPYGKQRKLEIARALATEPKLLLLDEPASGEILVDGESIEKKRNYCGYMPQQDLLFPWRTVRENLLLPMEIRGGYSKTEMREKADAALESVGLKDWGDKMPKELSGGMRQRAAFARTVLTGSDLLLLDEPFSALDYLTRISMREWLLEQWEREKKTVLFITHDVEEAVFLSSRILVVEESPITHLRSIDVPAEYPRSRDELRKPEILSLKEELIGMLRKETS